MRIIVVGAGILGASCAFQLQAAGAQVTVLDAGAASATQTSFGWINDSFYLDGAHYRLRAEGLAAYRRLGTQMETGIAWCASLSWDGSEAAREARYQELRGFGGTLRQISRAEFKALEPAVLDPPEDALLFPAEGIVDPSKLASAMLKAAQDKGAEVVRGVSVGGLLENGAGCGGVRTPLGPMRADQVVVCAGVHSARILETLGVALPMKSSPALMVRTRPQRPLARHVLSCDFGDVRQLPSGEIITPAALNHQASVDQPVEAPEAVADKTVKRLERLFGTEMDWSEVCLAQRPVPQDDQPVIGEARKGLYVAVMHSGVTLAGITGELAAQEMLKGPSNRSQDLLSPYRPARFDDLAEGA